MNGRDQALAGSPSLGATMAGSMSGERTASFAPYLLAALFYCVATWFTAAYFSADAADYARSMAEIRSSGDLKSLFEFGHLLWRPIAYPLWLLGGAVSSTYFDASVVGARHVLDVLAWLGGLLGAISMVGLLRALGVRGGVLALATAAFVLSQGFLNFAQTGTSYGAGLGCLVAGLWFLAISGTRAPEHGAQRWAALGGVAIAFSVLVWFLFLWAVPAALLVPVIFFGNTRENRRRVLVATASCAVAGAGTYAAVLAALGLTSPSAIATWVSSAGHGLEPAQGLARVIYGLPRAVINMGTDGLMVKRYLLKDPFNPVTPADIARLSLWKVALFYVAALAAVLVLLRTPRGRQALLYLALAAIPAIGFAIKWYGGDLERYLSILPALFVAVAFALERVGFRRFAAWPIVALVLAMAAVNLRAMSASGLAHDQTAVLERLGDLPERLPPEHLLVTSYWHDELVNLVRSYPERVNATGRPLHVYAAVTPGGPEVPTWQKELATRMLAVWDRGGEIWFARRALAPRPRREWIWAEGDDPRISWTAFPTFFSALRYSRETGGADGFLLLEHNADNIAVLRSAAFSASSPPR